MYMDFVHIYISKPVLICPRVCVFKPVFRGAEIFVIGKDHYLLGSTG